MDLVGFETAVYRRQHVEATNRLLVILRAIATNQPIVDDSEPEKARSSATMLCTRLAAAITALFADPQNRMNDSTFIRLCALCRAVDNVFAASAFGSSDHALKAMGLAQPQPGKPLRFASFDEALRFHSLFSLDCSFPLDIADIFEQAPKLALLLYTKYMSTKPIVTATGQARRERLLDLYDRLKPAPLVDPIDHVVQLANAWMLCSYAEHPRKHRVKATLNVVMRDWMQRRELTDAKLPAKRAKPERPTMVVAAEIMHSNHVQYRYFGQWLRQLRTRFRLVLVTDAREVDDWNRGLFDEVFSFTRSGEGGYLKEAVDYIKKTAPQVIFYLSVGMRHWGVAIANLRLAPIQMTAIGHSASTFCPTIDYYLIEQGYVGDPDSFSETVILLSDQSLRFERSPHAKVPAPQIREQANPLRIVFAANLLKLNPHFLGVCRKIVERSPRPLEIHAFPNNSGMELEAARQTIRRALPGARVYPILAYNEYLEKLNACDLSLSPWPFGGLHSVVDSLRQGVPVIALEGIEPHARTDAMLMRLLGLPEWLICHQEDEYIDMALRVIGDDRLRVELARQAVALDIDNRLFGDAATPLGTEIVDAAWWVYENHEAIKADGRKAWIPQARLAPL